MPDVNVLAILVATVVVFALGAGYNTLLGRQLAEVSDAAAAGEQPPWRFAVELLRCLITAAVVTGLVSQSGIDGWPGGLVLGLVLWIGFPLVLWIGAMIWQNSPWKLAAIHAGDSLVKLLAVAVIASVWQ